MLPNQSSTVGGYWVRHLLLPIFQKRPQNEDALLHLMRTKIPPEPLQFGQVPYDVVVVRYHWSTSFLLLYFSLCDVLMYLLMFFSLPQHFSSNAGGTHTMTREGRAGPSWPCEKVPRKTKPLPAARVRRQRAAKGPVAALMREPFGIFYL